MTEYLLSVDAYLEKTAAAGPIGTMTNAMTAPSLLEKGISKLYGFMIDKPKWAIGIGGAIGLGGAGYLGYHLLQKKNQERAQDKAFAQVSHGDPVLSEASKEELGTAFQTMRNFAPTLATDPNAVQSFLRSAVMSGGGVDYNTIKLLAETENAATGRFRKE